MLSSQVPIKLTMFLRFVPATWRLVPCPKISVVAAINALVVPFESDGVLCRWNAPVHIGDFSKRPPCKVHCGAPYIPSYLNQLELTIKRIPESWLRRFRGVPGLEVGRLVLALRWGCGIARLSLIRNCDHYYCT